MNKKLIIFLSAIIILVSFQFIYYNNKTEKVLVSGKVFGFNIQDTNQNQSDNQNNMVATSLKKIGTMTFKKLNSNYFAALGHSIKETQNIKTINGECFEIILDQIEKGTVETPGKIIAELEDNKKIGKVEYTNNYGLFGEYYENKNLMEMQTASRYKVKKAKAEILIDFNGNGAKRYEIQIKEINHWQENRNIKFDVISEELINKTGGIVQGMSGSPIIQNGKLVGAVNFVSIDNPTEGYGIFIDKLI